MFDFFLTLSLIEYIKIIIVLIATGYSAYTDYKTGYIEDYISYPFILIGFVFLFLGTNILLGLFSFILVFGFGYLFYKRGGIGGGDIKLLSALPLYFPLFQGVPLIISVLLFASVFSIFFYSSRYAYFIFSNKPKKLLLNVLISIALSVAFSLFFWDYILLSILLFYLFFVGFLNIAYKEFIAEKFYKKTILIKDLKEDDNADLTFMGKSENYPLDKKVFDKIHADFKPTDKITVYRNMPVFGPFIFLGCMLAFLISISFLFPCVACGL
jgi:Flp pilus assembly protein protease CpaA